MKHTGIIEAQGEPTTTKPASRPNAARSLELSAEDTGMESLEHRQGEPLAAWKGRIEAARAEKYKKVNTRIKKLVRTVSTAAMELQRLCWQMQDQKLYLAAGYNSYPDWVAGELRLGRSVGYDYADSGRLLQIIEKSECSDSPPTNPYQFRALHTLKDEQVPKVWAEAVKQAKLDQVGGGIITSAVVARARKTLFPPSKSGQSKELADRFTGALAKLWASWPEEDKDDFVGLLYASLGEYFVLLDPADFESQNVYRAIKNAVNC